MKHILILTVCLLCFKPAFAQVTPGKYVKSLKEKQGKSIALVIKGGHSVSVEGYDGDDLIVELVDTAGTPKNLTPEAAGLKDLTADLIGFMFRAPVKEISMQPKIWEPAEKNTLIDKFTLNLSWSFPDYQNLLVKVPRSTILSVYFSATSVGSKISAKNLSGELNISGNASFITVNHISGPLILQSSGANALGKVTISDIDWQNIPANRKNRPFLFMSCAGDDVDVSVPADLKANVTAGSTHGAFYSDLIPATQDPKATTNHNFIWTVNGGGIPIYITTTYGNIYLHKQK